MKLSSFPEKKQKMGKKKSKQNQGKKEGAEGVNRKERANLTVFSFGGLYEKSKKAEAHGPVATRGGDRGGG